MNNQSFQQFLNQIRIQRYKTLVVESPLFTSQQYLEIATAVGEDHYLRTLVIRNLNSTMLNEETLAAWCNSLNTHQTLTTLILTAPQLSNTHLQRLLQHLCTNTKLQALSINDAGLGDDAATHLTEFLINNNTLQRLTLAHNQLGDRGIQKLATALEQNNSLTSLDMENNRITNTGLTTIATALKINTTLNTLDVSNNSITDEAAPVLARALSFNTTLSLLKISGTFTDARKQTSLNTQINALLTQNNFASVQLRNELLELIKRKYTSTSSLSNTLLNKMTSFSCPSLLDIAANKVSYMLTEKAATIETARVQLPSDLFCPLMTDYYRRHNNLQNKRLVLFNPLSQMAEKQQNKTALKTQDLNFKLTPR